MSTVPLPTSSASQIGYQPPRPQAPTEELPCDEINAGELLAAIKHTKSTSSPSPFDQIPYTVFKQCRSLGKALLNLFNCCWSQAVIHPEWKLAAIKLVGKGSAIEDPTTPASFCPIELTTCVGKLLITILKNRWLNYMTRNGSLSSSIQKAFMKATPGCIEHQCKLAAILAEARKNHKSLALCWLDPANAYGSVHHSLIQFSISHYHAPPQFCSIIQSLYSDLSGTVVTNDWSTATIPLELGVYQGDPLSVVIFNTWLTPCRPDQTLVSFSPTLTTRSTSCNMQMTPASRPTAQLLVSVSWTWLTGGSNGQV